MVSKIRRLWQQSDEDISAFYSLARENGYSDHNIDHWLQATQNMSARTDNGETSKKKQKICWFCGKGVPSGTSMKKHSKNCPSRDSRYYGTNGLLMNTNYVMIHRESCAHTRHMTVMGIEDYGHAYGTLRDVYVWAVKLSRLGLSIYYCSNCSPPQNTPIRKEEEKALRGKHTSQFRR